MQHDEENLRLLQVMMIQGGFILTHFHRETLVSHQRSYGSILLSPWGIGWCQLIGAPVFCAFIPAAPVVRSRHASGFIEDGDVPLVIHHGVY